LNHVEPIYELRQDGKLILGYVGVIGIQDGVDYFVRTLHELKVTHAREDFRAVIVGNGPAMADLKSLARELDVFDLIHFTGMIPFPSVPAYIATFDICFTPDPSNSYNDSCTTIKTMEYMALRKPTVCFRTRENELTAGESAIYANNNDISDYARATVKLMNDSALRSRLGQIGRERVDNGLTWEHQSKHLIALYDDLFGLPTKSTQHSAPVSALNSKESLEV
jgi:glycosyltransferase involved in cell wall biosynthesis